MVIRCSLHKALENDVEAFDLRVFAESDALVATIPLAPERQRILGTLFPQALCKLCGLCTHSKRVPYGVTSYDIAVRTLTF